MPFRKTSTLLTATLCAGLFAAPVLAQNKPQIAPGYAGKPTRVLVSAGAGGGMDTITRAVASKLSDRLGITMLVDNVSGASGVIAVDDGLDEIAAALEDFGALFGGWLV